MRDIVISVQITMVHSGTSTIFVIVCNAYHDLRTNIYLCITIEDHLCINL